MTTIDVPPPSPPPATSPRSPETGAAATRLVEAACALIARAEEAPALAPLAAAVGTTPDRLRHAFRSVLGVTPHQYADSVRLARFRAEVQEGTPVTQALFRAGYSSTSRLYEGADARLGMTPASYGAGGRGARVTFSVVESPLGWLCVGVTERGVCHIGLADTEADAVASLTAALPYAEHHADVVALAEVVDDVLARLDGRAPHHALPLDVRGTAFQRRVWEELQHIPPGETRTYAQLAAAVGEPRAARAVGRACATNPVAVVVPCHRVVRADGGLGGYAWGVERKRALLAREAPPT